jgi:riboflavin kinase / FMN adenylyltransferase
VAAPPFLRIDDITPAAPADPELLIIGNFDGVHRGHQAVLAHASTIAAKAGLATAVLTFDPHPAAVLGREPPAALTTLLHKAQLLRQAGARSVWVRTFDRDFAGWSPERFARELVKEQLRASVVVVGDNFRFGAQRGGDHALLRTLGAALDFTVEPHPMAGDEGGPFSSTRVRAALAEGDVVGAAAVLGRRHAFSGVVREGDKRGRTIGFPTANVEEVTELVPKNGVYAVTVEQLDPLDLAGSARAIGQGVMNVGVRPTVDGSGRRTQEVHLLDFAGDLYGRTLRVQLVARLRDEKKFDGVLALKAQIAEDVAEAKQRLKDS